MYEYVCDSVCVDVVQQCNRSTHTHTLTCLGDTTQTVGNSPWYLQRNLVQAVGWTHWRALEEARGRQRQVASGVADTFEDLGAAPLALLLALLFYAFLALVLLGTLEIMQAKEEH